tara:strand:- start:1643 stop:2452 length:810 start_codon:yes stop_codon:yes gene_type:complete
MSQPKAIPHPHDDGKWMSSFDSYGHGPGNGKSRNAIYKRFKKVNGPDFVKNTPSEKEATESLKNKTENKAKSEQFSQARSTAILETVEKSLQEPQDSPESRESEDEPDSVKWGSIEWDEPEIDAEVKTSTIPKPLSEMAQGQRMAFNQESQAQMIRVGFRALDRALTHYGRGVMNSKDWSVDRSESDYDALEGATSAVLEHYGVQVPVSPLMVLGVTLTTAYAPPLNHIRKNADPNRKRGRFLSAFGRLIPKRFRKKQVRGEPDEPLTE